MAGYHSQCYSAVYRFVIWEELAKSVDIQK